ncbi:hypothetical protein BKA63DRAFT_577881 [Paraphoma chrysanthemicola]|nr:hypothetical protein BKA63DRAFT_577881 [Paraphoma chrysanthemicola]
MRAFALVAAIVYFVTLFSGGAVGASLGARQLGLVDIPPCGVPASGCALDDNACVCENVALAQELSACMLTNCTMADSLGTSRVQADICGFSNESKRMQMFWYTGVVYSLAVLFVALRIAGKVVSKRLSWDDWVVVAALLLTTIPLACVLAMTKIGFGEHLWNLEDGRLMPILRFFYISWSTYVVVLGLIKVSLVLFYLQIFQTRQFRIAAYAIMAYIMINTLIIFLLTIFACDPVLSFWNRDIKGKCMDIQALAYANSASAILQDVILLVLPLAFIRKLQMKRYRKIAVGVMFSIGTFGCVATIIRLQTLLEFKISIDPTWDYVPVTIWTELELVVGFVCVSLPSIRILIVKALPVKVKEFLSHITSRSSRSNQTPQAETPKGSRDWKKPSSWINITLEANDSGHGSAGGRSFRSVFSRDSMTPSTHRHMRNGSRRLESAMSHYSESEVAVTRPPYHEPVELLNIPNPQNAPVRDSFRSQSSRDSRITALPTISKIGCLPEGSFSDLDVRRNCHGLNRNKC